MAVASQTTAQKLEENPLLPTDTQHNLVYTLTRIFRLLAQIVNPLVAWVADTTTWIASFAGFSVTHPNPATGSTLVTIEPIAPNAAGSSTLLLRKSAPGTTNNNTIQGNTGANVRWIVQLGNGEVETGANAGSAFAIYRYSDAGALLGGAPAFSIRRSDAYALFSGRVDVAGSFNAGATVNITGAVATGSTIVAAGRITSTAVDVAALYATAGGIYTEYNNAGALRATAGGVMVSATYGLNGIGSLPDGPNHYSRISSVNPAWNICEIQGYHQSGVWAGMRMLGATNQIQFSLSNGGSWGSVKAASFDVQSDIRTKENIEPIIDALGKLDGIRAYTYNRKDAKTKPISEADAERLALMNDIEFPSADARVAGLMAQDVLPRLPEAVTVPPDPADTLSLDTAAVTALNSQAISELLAIVRAQGERIAVLENA
jgi:hypothetical protein